MKSITILIAILLLLLLSPSAPPVLAADGSDSLWAYNYGGTQADYGVSAKQVTLGGGFITIGNTLSFGAGGTDIYVVRVDDAGDTIWTTTYGGSGDEEARTIILMPDSGFVFGGWTDSYGAGGDDFYLIRTDKDGDTLWTKTYGTSVNEQCWGLDTTFDGGFILSGYTLPSGSNYNGYLVRTNASGDTIWTATFAGAGNAYERFRYVISLDSDSQFVCCGDTGILQTAPASRMMKGWVVKIDTSGTQVWTRSIGSGAGYPYETFYSVEQCFDGGFILGGHTDTYGSGAEDFLLTKLSSNGDSLWTYPFGGTNDDECHSVVQVVDSGFIMTGETKSFGNGSPTAGFDVWVVKTDQDGDSLWSEVYGGTLSDVAEGIIQTTEREFLITGWSNSFAVGSYDIWLLKIGRKESPPDSLWSYVYGGVNGDIYNAIEYISDDGYIVAGENKSQTDADGEAWVSQLDTNGQVNWEMFLGDTNENLFKDILLIANNDSVVCVGATKTGVYNGYLAKVTTSGDSIWTQSYGGADDDYFYSVAEDVIGNFIMCGYTETYGYSARKDGWLYLVDNSGDSLWSYSYGLGSLYQDCRLQQVIATSDTNYVCAGFQGFYTGPLGGRYSDFWLFKTDAGADTIFDSTYSQNQYDYARSICERASGGYLLAGNTITESGDEDVMVVRVANDGTHLWTRTYGGGSNDNAYRIQETGNGDYVISGYTNSYGAGDSDFWLLKIDAMGDSIWSVRFGGTNSDPCYGYYLLNDSTYILVGETSSFGVGNGDGWILKAGMTQFSDNTTAWGRARFHKSQYSRGAWNRPRWGR